MPFTQPAYIREDSDNFLKKPNKILLKMRLISQDLLP